MKNKKTRREKKYLAAYNKCFKDTHGAHPDAAGWLAIVIKEYQIKPDIINSDEELNCYIAAMIEATNWWDGIIESQNYRMRDLYSFELITMFDIIKNKGTYAGPLIKIFKWNCLTYHAEVVCSSESFIEFLRQFTSIARYKLDSME